jgi:trk system potassium uptake protein TrkA
MHVVIVGCGRVGSTLARGLSAEGNTVTVVDRRSSAFSRLGSDYAGQTVTGIGFDRDVLVRAGIERASALAAVTNGDNSNILVARVAREQFGIERVVARIYDPKRAEIYERLGIATVAAVEWTDPSAKVSLVEREAPVESIGERILSLDLGGERVVAVRRLGAASIPGPDTVLQEGDVLYLAVPTNSLEQQGGAS